MPAVFHAPVSNVTSAFHPPQVRQRASVESAHRRLVYDRGAAVSNPNPTPTDRIDTERIPRTDCADVFDEPDSYQQVVADDSATVSDSISAYIELRKSYARTAKEERRTTAMQRRRQQIEREYLVPPTLSANQSARIERFRRQCECDYAVVTDDGTIRAHRDILTAASTEFDTQTNSIRLHDTDAVTALRLVETIYAQTVLCKPPTLNGIHNALVSDEQDRPHDEQLTAPPLRSFIDVFALLRSADSTGLNGLFSFLCLIAPFTVTPQHTRALSIVICWCQHVEDRIESSPEHNGSSGVAAAARSKLKSETVYRLKREFSGVLRRRGRDVVAAVIPEMSVRLQSMNTGHWRFADETAAVLDERRRVAAAAVTASISAPATDDATRLEHTIPTANDIAAAACSCAFFTAK